MRRYTKREIEYLEFVAAERRKEYAINYIDILHTVEYDCKVCKFWLGQAVCRKLYDDFCAGFWKLHEADSKYFSDLEKLAKEKELDDYAIDFFHELSVAAANGYEPDDFLFDYSVKWREVILEAVL